MNELAFLVEDSAAGGFAAHGIGTDIRVEADTLPELQAQVLAAVVLHFDDPACAPMPVRFYICTTRRG